MNRELYINVGLKVIIGAQILNVSLNILGFFFKPEANPIKLSIPIILGLFFTWGLLKRVNYVRVFLIVITTINLIGTPFILIMASSKLNQAGVTWAEAVNLSGIPKIGWWLWPLSIIHYAYWIWSFIFLISGNLKSLFKKKSGKLTRH